MVPRAALCAFCRGWVVAPAAVAHAILLVIVVSRIQVVFVRLRIGSSGAPFRSSIALAPELALLLGAATLLLLLLLQLHLRRGRHGKAGNDRPVSRADAGKVRPGWVLRNSAGWRGTADGLLKDVHRIRVRRSVLTLALALTAPWAV